MGKAGRDENRGLRRSLLGTSRVRHTAELSISSTVVFGLVILIGG